MTMRECLHVKRLWCIRMIMKTLKKIIYFLCLFFVLHHAALLVMNEWVVPAGGSYFSTVEIKDEFKGFTERKFIFDIQIYFTCFVENIFLWISLKIDTSEYYGLLLYWD